MPSVADFLEEVNAAFGFYFDVAMACHLAKERLEEMQRATNFSDDSNFLYGEGPPQNTPDKDIERPLHATTVSALKRRLEPNGYDRLRAAEAAIVFVYHIWEEKYRRNLIDRDGQPLREIESNIMGDLRLLRNSIIHNKGVAENDVDRCKVITKFRPGDHIAFFNEDVCAIIRAMRSDLSNYL